MRLGIDSCEMESHQLYHLCSEREKERKRKENEKEMKEKETKDNSNSESKQGPTRAASICLGVVNRVDPSAPSQLIRKSEVRLLLGCLFSTYSNSLFLYLIAFEENKTSKLNQSDLRC